jgi:3-hydroxyisobutyrate dehydrogenase-like beta-hydroxyacid dehydrogenase
MNMAPPLAFLGLGIMGAAMARRLVEAGRRVTVYNRTASKCAPLASLGARSAPTPREAARDAGCVISIVTDSPDVEQVLLGPEGAAAGAAPGSLFIDMSTIAPAAARRIGEALRAKGFAFLDAPVTGGDVGAREGTLSILVGGEAADLDRAREVFVVLGKRITHCGPLGAGQTMKAANQILCALNMLGMVEAFHFARRNGIDLNVLLEALTAGAGGSWTLERLGPRVARGDFAPGFMVRLLQKDLRIVQDAARSAGVPLDGVSLAQRYFADNEAQGEGDRGTQAMYKALERRIEGSSRTESTKFEARNSKQARSTKLETRGSEGMRT